VCSLGANADASVVRTRTRFNQEKRSSTLRVSRRKPVRSRDRNEAEAFMVLSLVVPSATHETGDAALYSMNARQCGAAFAAGVEIFSLEANAFQREIVAPGFVWNAQIAASLTPLGAMRCDVPASGAMLGEKVGELMPQGSLNFGRRDFDQFRIEGDRLCPPAREAGGRPKPGVPFDGHIELLATGCTKELATKLFEEEVALEAPQGRPFAVSRGIGKQAQMAENGFSEVEHDELSLFHQAAMGCAWRSTTVARARRQCSM